MKVDINVEDWLGTDNKIGIDIWHKKYQRNDETFEQWVNRVSGNNDDVAKLVLEKKFLPGGRILSNRGITSEKVTYSNCFSGETRILTQEGILPLSALVGRDNIMVLSNGAWRAATVQSFGIRKVKILNIEKRGIEREIRVTGDHTWFVAKKESGKFAEVKTDELKPGMRLRSEAIKCFRRYKPSPFGVAHGFFFGDGDHVGENRRINFCGDKSELVGSYGDTTTICGIPRCFWVHPSLSETKSYLYGWLAGCFAADGSIDERGSCTITSANRGDLDFVRDVLCVLGIPSEQIRVQTRVSNLTGLKSDVFILTLNRYYLNENFFILSKHRERFCRCGNARVPDLWSVKSVSDVDCEEEVFCATVPSTHSFALDGNILTHNCYVVAQPEDSIESIYESRKKLARTYSYGGGCGIDLSKLAPAGARVHNQAKMTTGAVSFMQGFSQTTEEIGQNGRRGALMISLSCTHPDLLEFIKSKMDVNAVTKANISVRVTDAFMEAVKNADTWTLAFTREETEETIEKTVQASDVFDLLCRANWDYAEPGILFWDRIEQWNMLSNNPEFAFSGVNPCAEEPLPAGGSCLLGSINLAEFVNNEKFNYASFADTVHIATRCLNDVLEEGLMLHPLEEQRKSVSDWRQIGLGIMGLADMLIKMGVRYGSQESIALCDSIGRLMIDSAVKESALLAKERGPYPKYRPELVDTPFFKANINDDTSKLVGQYGLRNSQLLTIAPTGTLSTMLGISGGVEPIFANYYMRKTESLHGKDVAYKVYTPIVSKYMKEHGLEDDAQLPDYFVTAGTLNHSERIEMQGVWQSHIDASISSTINLPNSATTEDVKDIYISAWKHGLKGITIFRDGCKRAGILTTENPEEKVGHAPPEKTLSRGDIIECSEDLVGKKRKLTTGCGSLHVLAYFDPVNGEMQEVYLNKGSTGGCANFMTGLSRTISLLCRAGVSVYDIKDQLDSTGACPAYATRRAVAQDTSKGSCCPMAIGNALIEMYEETRQELDDTWEEKADQTKEDRQAPYCAPVAPENVVPCPECGAPLIFEGGCNSCKNCGYSKCG